MLAVSATHALAQASDLIGTWTTETTILLKSGGEIVEAPRKLSVVIEDVDGKFVRGYRTWQAKAPVKPGYVGDIVLSEAREPFIGTVTADGKSIHLV